MALTSLELEKAQGGSEGTIDVETFGRKYTINVAKMEQINDDTGVVRKIQRAKSGSNICL